MIPNTNSYNYTSSIAIYTFGIVVSTGVTSVEWSEVPGVDEAEVYVFVSIHVSASFTGT